MLADNSMQPFVLKIIVLVVGYLFTLASYAESETFGDYTIHYQAVNSTFIDAGIAEQYGITRSDRHAFLNISVLKATAGGGMTPVTAAVSGGKRNLLGQVGAIDFREIREGDAIYYIGEFEFSNAGIVRFIINVQPEQTGQTHEVRWETRMYNE